MYLDLTSVATVRNPTSSDPPEHRGGHGRCAGLDPTSGGLVHTDMSEIGGGNLSDGRSGVRENLGCQNRAFHGGSRLFVKGTKTTK